MDERFWRKVRKTRSCWVWIGARNDKSYGHLRVDGKDMYAHRWSWILANGAIPDGLLVLHKCDRRWCVKPDHLFLGTHKDNSADMWAKGRGVGGSVRGENHHCAKLNDEMVRQIREAYEKGSTQVDLSKRFNVAQTNISRIVKRRAWKHVVT